MREAWHLGAWLVALSSCVSSGAELTRRQAARDLRCPASMLKVYMLSGESDAATGAVFGAHGCGKRLTYVRDKLRVLPSSPLQVDTPVAPADPPPVTAVPAGPYSRSWLSPLGKR